MSVPVGAVREFNRDYTRVIGVLGAGYLQTPYSLTEARVLYELNQRTELPVRELRSVLDLNAGYLSRILRGFESAGLVSRRRHTEDGRQQVVALTDSGRATAGTLDERAETDVAALLDRLDETDQRRLTGAMAVIRDLLGERTGTPAVVLRPPAPGDLGWVVSRNGALYGREYGWDETYEALVARIVADYGDQHDPAREACWIAEVDGERAGAVFCVRGPDSATGAATAKLRLLHVEPAYRGAGLGGRLVTECLRFARRAGYRQVTLWTNDVLTSARRIYARAGFVHVDSEPHHSFGHDLVGETWTLAL